ncbi:major tail protein [Mycobacterium phage TChen]|uniref:Major tail protein n=3 Tax=Thetabobvirus TaxID=2843467 RepID=A0A385DZI7_9CAUD|nr:major tail protein [Mycobacterium phage TChen]YP_009841037.1 major tail protein [Mycobacterium phage Renaud18]YP_009848831.1 major tail protein [Mycobacterium phage ThetaBob]UCR74388.1 major tail protein [Mycobacterium phage Saroj]UZV39538.1 major tail [Mycobacterium phage Ritam007]AWH14413.1 major tail protein [Mycobacterium phage TChen]AXQ64923.1 major tail protein [Mycobacterium phage Renaud18]QDF19899.1 major tail protein [Mycobacterium phage ThetaBob]
MTQPSTGTSWGAGGFAFVHKPTVERGGLQCVAIRDNRGAETDMSPFEEDGTTVKFTPFAQDGRPRSDLFARRIQGGKIIHNPNPNLGWFQFGAQTEDGGAERNPNMRSDDMMVLQSKFPVDSDVIEKGKTIRFTGVQTADPLLHRLENELRLTDDNGDSLVPDLGDPNYFSSDVIDADSPEYQLLLFFARRTSGGFIYRVEGYPAVKLDDQGSKRRSKTDPDTAELTYKALPNEYFMVPDPNGSGVLVPGGLQGIWYGGPGWTDMAPDAS